MHIGLALGDLGAAPSREVLGTQRESFSYEVELVDAAGAAAGATAGQAAPQLPPQGVLDSAAAVPLSDWEPDVELDAVFLAA